MAKIGKLWAGKLYGTNTGNLSVELSPSDGGFTGTVRFMDDRFGIVLYSISGIFDGTNIEFSGNSTQAPEGITTGKILAIGLLTPEGHIRGQWSSTLGTGGTFHLFPHDANLENAPSLGSLPERLHKHSAQSDFTPTIFRS